MSHFLGPRLSRQKDLGSPHEPGLQQAPACSEPADNLGSCQRIPPALPASLCQPCHVPPSCQTLPTGAMHPFYLWVERKGITQNLPKASQGLGTALGGLGM